MREYPPGQAAELVAAAEANAARGGALPKPPAAAHSGVGAGAAGQVSCMPVSL